MMYWNEKKNQALTATVLGCSVSISIKDLSKGWRWLWLLGDVDHHPELDASQREQLSEQLTSS